MKSLSQIFENKNAYINEMYLINGFGWASPGFGLDLPIGSGRARGSLHFQVQGLHQWTTLRRDYDCEEGRHVALIKLFVKNA